MNLNLLSTMPAALVRSVNDDLLNKFVHDLRCQLGDMLMLLYCSDESSHIGGLLFGSINVGCQLGSCCSQLLQQIRRNVNGSDRGVFFAR